MYVCMFEFTWRRVGRVRTGKVGWWEGIGTEQHTLLYLARLTPSQHALRTAPGHLWYQKMQMRRRHHSKVGLPGEN